MRNDSDDYAALDHAWELYLDGQLEAALQLAEATLEADAGSAAAHNLVGTIKAAMGQPEEALAHYETAIATDPLSFESLLNAGDVLIQLAKPAAALERLETALELAGDKDAVADVLLLTMDALFALNRGPEAAKILEQMPAGPFDSPNVEFLIGRAALQAGVYERAAALLEEALVRGVDDPDLHYYVALSREAVSDFRGATIAFLECRERDLRSPMVPWGETTPAFERRVEARVRRLPERLSRELEGTLIIVDAFPGVEMVAEGLDPRAPAMMDEVPLRESGETLRRLFVYHRNIDRFCPGPHAVDADLDRVLATEIEAFLKAPRLPEV